ncbi:MAG: hypothetical protein ABIS29_11755 [Vicinamibacterales bacterium]
MKTRHARIARIASVLMLISSLAEAQQLAGTFDQLRVLIKPGDTLTITDDHGQRLRGKLVDLSASSLVLVASGTRRLFQDTEVSTIEKRGADSLKNGALIGLSIGAGLFGPVIGAVTGDWGLAAAGALFYGGIGMGIGAGGDALIEGPRVIYAAAPSARRTVNVAPILSRSRKGVLLSIGLGR